MSIISTLSRRLWQQKWFKAEWGRSLYKRICRDEEAPDYFFRKDFYGLQYEGNLKNNIDFSIFYYGAFEKPLLHFLRDVASNVAKPDSVFIDVGANIGQHSLYMSQRVSQVHAFEPFSEVSQRLQHHMDLNKLNNIDLHSIALSDKTEQRTFYAPTGRNQGIGSFDPSTVGKGNQAIAALALVKGDDYLAEHDINQVDILKIDVEGYEKKVLSGLSKTLSQSRPLVVCEISYQRAQSFASMQELKQAFPDDYRFFTFHTRKNDGTKARKKGAQSRLSGNYNLVPFDFTHPTGQDDIIACPIEFEPKLPLGNN